MNRPASMLAFITAVLVTCASPVGATTWEDMAGPHPTVLIERAGSAGEFYIRRPEKLSSNSHPVAVVLVGSFSHPQDYDGLFKELASHGVVVIAHSSSYQGDGSEANAALNWLLEQNEVSTSEYFHNLIPSKVLAIGHSSGGNGAVLASIQNPRITSLLLYAPALSSANLAELRVPTFFIAGALDGAVTPDNMRAKYQQVTKAPACEREPGSHRVRH
jgi:dienelactone hydrolase